MAPNSLTCRVFASSTYLATPPVGIHNRRPPVLCVVSNQKLPLEPKIKSNQIKSDQMRSNEMKSICHLRTEQQFYNYIKETHQLLLINSLQASQVDRGLSSLPNSFD